MVESEMNAGDPASFDVSERRFAVVASVREWAALLTAAEIISDAVDSPELNRAALQIVQAMSKDRDRYQQELGAQVLPSTGVVH